METEVYECKECETTDETKFSHSKTDICETCLKLTKNKVYSCKYCNETNLDCFEHNRYSTCKKCLNTMKSNSRKKKSKEKLHEKTPVDKDTYLTIDKYLTTNHSLMGIPVKNYITELNSSVSKLEEDVVKITDKNLDLGNLLAKLYTEYKDLKNKYKILEEKVKKLEQ